MSSSKGTSLGLINQKSDSVAEAIVDPRLTYSHCDMTKQSIPPPCHPKHLLLPAAGLGERMKTVDRNLPKELLPILDKPSYSMPWDCNWGRSILYAFSPISDLSLTITHEV
jgi:hypothetical protein